MHRVKSICPLLLVYNLEFYFCHSCKKWLVLSLLILEVICLRKSVLNISVCALHDAGRNLYIWIDAERISAAIEWLSTIHHGPLADSFTSTPHEGLSQTPRIETRSCTVQKALDHIIQTLCIILPQLSIQNTLELPSFITFSKQPCEYFQNMTSS